MALALSTTNIQLDPGICTKTSRIQLMYGFWVNLTYLAIGLGFGFAAVQVPQLSGPNSEIPITRNDASWIASVLLLFCPVGSIISGFVTDRAGRRFMIIMSQVPIFIGWLFTSLAKTPSHIIIARAITGIGCGMSICPPRVYDTEISLPNIRGILGSFPNVALSLGITLQAVLNLFFDWQFVSNICCANTLAIFFSFIFLPETPYFVLITQGVEAARATLTKFRFSDYDIDNEMKEIIEFRNENNIRKLTCYQNLKALVEKAACKPFCVIVSYIVLGQLAGVTSLMFYSIELLTAAHSSFDVYAGNILLALTSLVMGVVMSVLLYRIERRPLALTSAFGVTLIGFTIGALLMYNDEPSLLPLICFILYNVFANLGYSVLPHLMAFELLPLQVRGTLGGTLVSMHCLLMFASTKVQPFMLERFGVDYMFIIFGGFSFVGFVFLCLFLPETKDLTLQEIEEYYKEIRPTLVSQRRINMSVGLLQTMQSKSSFTNLNRDANRSMTFTDPMLAKLEAKRQLAILHKQNKKETKSLKPSDSKKPTDSKTPTDRKTPTDSKKPTDSQTPTDSKKPTDSQTPTDSKKPTDSQTPTDRKRSDLTLSEIEGDDKDVVSNKSQEDGKDKEPKERSKDDPRDKYQASTSKKDTQ